MNGITLNPDEQNHLRQYLKEWFCCMCLSSVLPFNQILDDVEFVNALKNEIRFQELAKSVNRLPLFHPSEITDDGIDAPIADIDPDENFFN